MNQLTDEELLAQLKRVQSDLSFRRWTRKRVFLMAALILIDLIASVGSISAIFIGLHTQHTTCTRDNELRKAYVAQWQPVLDQPPAVLPDNATPQQKATYEAQLQTRQRFQDSLNVGFKQHTC